MFRFQEGLLCPVVLACLAAYSCTPAATAPPAIELSAVPDAAEGGTGRLGPIAGLVRGARPGDHVVIYAHSGVWWVQPYAAQPLTDIAADGSWSSQIHLGTEYAAFLVDAGYKPTPKIDTLPAAGGGVRAVATRKGAGTLTERPRKTIAFSGYEWDVRRSPSDRGGPNDYDPENAWVDDAGALHLKIARRGDQWTSAEVALTRPLGYGTYVFVVRLPPDLAPAAAFSLITWDDEGLDQNHRELDVEMSRWGDPRTANTQYVVQPYYVAANVHRFTSPAGRLTHSFRWEPGRASFRSFRGADTTGDHPIARYEFTAGVPTPGNERVRMNLYYFRYSPASLETEVEVVVERFQYLP
jgi:hypothetical protein